MRASTAGAIASDVVLLLVMSFAFPVAVLVIGAPVALLARLLFEIIRRS
jgi:hypothetical protein